MVAHCSSEEFLPTAPLSASSRFRAKRVWDFSPTSPLQASSCCRVEWVRAAARLGPPDGLTPDFFSFLRPESSSISLAAGPSEPRLFSSQAWKGRSEADPVADTRGGGGGAAAARDAGGVGPAAAVTLGVDGVAAAVALDVDGEAAGGAVVALPPPCTR